MEYANQYNNPDDLYRYHWNVSQERQQERLAKQGMFGGSWSQPPWSGWKPITGAGREFEAPERFFQRYAQDGDSGFFRGMKGGAEPIGVSPTPPNQFHPMGDTNAPQEYVAPEVSTIKLDVPIPAPAPMPQSEDMVVAYSEEPQQRATYAPPFSQTLKQGMGKIPDDSVLHEEPFEFKYKGGFHKKKGRK